MPIVHSIEKTMKERVDEFYGNASVYRTNKFLVGLYGEYVGKAIAKMEKESKIDSVSKNQKLSHGGHVYNDAFNNWKKVFYYADNPPQVELKWACSNVTIPHTSSKISTENYIDSIKSIKYPVIMGTSEGGKVVMEIREDKHLLWYQFFNAIINQFYSSQILKPKSSFQKVGIYIALLQEQFVNDVALTEFNKPRKDTIDTVVSQVFEFNSAVLSDISSMVIKNDSKDIMEYKVTFDVPNTFQGSFNDAFRGLRDNTSIGIDSTMLMNGTTQYNTSAFESSKLKDPMNGYYKD